MKWTKESWYLACLKSARDSALNGERLAAEISPLALLHERWNDVKGFLAQPILEPGIDYWEGWEI